MIAAGHDPAAFERSKGGSNPAPAIWFELVYKNRRRQHG